MTVNERMQQLREQIANTPNKADKKAPFIELLAYYNYARSNNGYENDITDVKDLESKWKNDITQYGIFDKLYDNLTDEQIIDHSNDPFNFTYDISRGQNKYIEDLIKAEEDKFFETHERISKNEFLYRAAKNGWALRNDTDITGGLYSVATKSNDKKYAALYEKFLTTDARDPAVRKQMLTELKDARSTLVVKPHFFVPFYIGIKWLDKKLKNDPTREDIDAASKKYVKKYEEEQRAEEEYRRKKAKKNAEKKALEEREAKEQAELGETLEKNGWANAKEVAEKFYTILAKPMNRKETEKNDGINEFFEKLKSTKLEKGTEYKQMNALIEEGIGIFDNNTSKIYKQGEYNRAKAYLNDEVRSKAKENKEFEARLKENGWKSKEISMLYDVTHLGSFYIKDNKPLNAFYDKLWDTKIDKKFPITHKNNILKELEDTYNSVKNNKNPIDITRFKDVKGEKAEQEAYYGFNKIDPKEIKGSRSKEADIRGGVPTFDKLVKNDDAQREQQRLEQEQNRLEQEQNRIWQERFEAQREPMRIELAKQKALEVKTSVKNKLDNYLREMATAPAFYQKGHQDSAQIRTLKAKTAELIGTVNNSQGNLKENEQFRNQLFEAYKAATEYKRVKRIEAKRDPDDESYEPGSPMGQARWRAADIIIDLAKKYAPKETADYETQQEQIAGQKIVNSEADKAIEKEYAAVKKEIKAFDKTLSKNPGALTKKESDKLTSFAAKVIAMQLVNRVYQADSEMGVYEGFNKDSFVFDVTKTMGDIRERADFKHLMQTASPQEIITAASTNGGKQLLDKLATAKKAVAANEEIALQNANANENALENNNTMNNPTGQIKPANK